MAARMMKDVCTKNEVVKIHHRGELGMVARPVGERCTALKKRVPIQKLAIETSDL